MLHIVLLILKIVGILIAAIIGLLILLVLILLSASFSYTAEISADNSLESIRGRIRFHWLVHLISGQFSYEEGELSWQVRTAWKLFRSGADSEALSQKNMNTDRGNPEKKSGQKADLQADSGKHDKPEKTADLFRGDPGLPQSEENTEPDIKKEKNRQTYIKSENIHYNAHPDRSRSRPDISKIYEKIRKFWGKIKYTFTKICDNIKILEKRKEKISHFLHDKIHQAAFFRLIKELKRFFRFMQPKKASVNFEFGFENPAYTGYTLAGISLFYPMLAEHVRIRPDFEHKVLKGKAYIKGNFRILYALIFAWNMFCDRNVRRTYRHIRRFRL